MYKLFYCVLILLLFLGCSGNSKDEKNIKLTKFWWVIENLGENAFGEKAGCYYNFWLDYEGDIELSDLEYVRIKVLNNSVDNGRFWTLKLSEKYFNKEEKFIGGWVRCIFTNNTAVLPIGKLEAEVKLKNGQITKIEKDIPAPGSLTSGDYKYIYNSEEYTTNQTDYVQNIKRANVTSALKDLNNNSITIAFNVNDSRIYNGSIYFYDNAGEFIGVFENFRDKNSKNIVISSFNTSGVNNILVLKKSDIKFDAGKDIVNIYEGSVALRDGEQYSDVIGKLPYDCVSVSAPVYF